MQSWQAMTSNPIMGQASVQAVVTDPEMRLFLPPPCWSPASSITNGRIIAAAAQRLGMSSQRRSTGLDSQKLRRYLIKVPDIEAREHPAASHRNQFRPHQGTVCGFTGDAFGARAL